MTALLRDSFTYAFRGNGKFNFFIGAGLFLAASIVTWAPVLGAIASWLLWCYMVATYYGMVEASASGEDEAPMFPEVSNGFEDVIYPGLKLLVIGALSYSPLIAFRLLGGDECASWISFFGLVACSVYYLMAKLAVIVLGRLSAMSPHIVFPAIKRAGSTFWVACGGGLLLAALQVGLNKTFGHVPIFGAIPQAAVSMYVLMTGARLLALVYRERAEQLNWL